ncbi:hypothetical protein EWM64_g801 [Hericium alpestre]|uniref:Uncharacterized protein n=1 Tax=Hericium alpestre TaxID=135208 RepID=A0A4Z0A9J3_9AGAM|nr:hypothetical protein EWM64_g801 [Hericium alpestre]
MRNKIHFMDKDFDVSGIFAQFAVFKKCYETLKFGPLKKQIGMDSHGRGPKQVYYVHEVRDQGPPILRYGIDGCPTKRQLQALRLVHGRRREMWYPMAYTLPPNCPMEAKMPRAVIYEDEDPHSADPSPSDKRSRVSGIEGGMQMLSIEEGVEEDVEEAAPLTAVSSGNTQVVIGRA